jgi:hypothetical protein
VLLAEAQDVIHRRLDCDVRRLDGDGDQRGLANRDLRVQRREQTGNVAEHGAGGWGGADRRREGMCGARLRGLVGGDATRSARDRSVNLSLDRRMIEALRDASRDGQSALGFWWRLLGRRLSQTEPWGRGERNVGA